MTRAAGGYARAKTLSPERRREIALKAARARWGEKRPSMRRFPWRLARAFDVQSCADGSLIVRPSYYYEPGVFTRIRLARWAAKELNRRRPKR